MQRSVLPELKGLGYLRRQGRGTPVSLVPDGPERLTVISTGLAAGWSVPEGKLLWEIHAPAEAGTARGDLVLLGAQSLHLWRQGALAHHLEGHRGRICQVALSPDGQLAVSLAEDGLKVWALEPPALLRELPALGAGLRLDWERRVAWVTTPSGDCNRVEKWDLTAGVRLGTEEEQLPAGASILEGQAWGGEDGTVTWQGQSWQAHEEAVTALAVEPEGRWLASACAARLVRVWSAPDQLWLELDAYQDWITCQALNSQGQWLALGTEQGTVRVVEALTGKLRHEWEEHADTILALCFSPNGRRLATGSEDGLVGLAELTCGEFQLLDAHDAGPHCMAFSPDGRLLATGSAADEVVIWDVDSGLVLETLIGLGGSVEHLQFSPQGLLSALYDDGSVILWETSRYSV